MSQPQIINIWGNRQACLGSESLAFSPLFLKHGTQSSLTHPALPWMCLQADTTQILGESTRGKHHPPYTDIWSHISNFRDSGLNASSSSMGVSFFI